jgi:hypothetical protein
LATYKYLHSRQAEENAEGDTTGIAQAKDKRQQIIWDCRRNPVKELIINSAPTRQHFLISHVIFENTITTFTA